jgi:cell division septum initiation protein DivIVA
MSKKRYLPNEVRPIANPLGSSLQKLLAENEQLKQRVQELESECARYREACQAWIVERYTRDDIKRMVAKDAGACFQPLEHFIGELEAIVKGRRKKGA